MWCSVVQGTTVHLYLTIVADGFNRNGGSQGAVRIPGPELHNTLGSAHQPTDSAAVLKELLFLILRTHNTKKKMNFCVCDMHTHLLFLYQHTMES